MTSRVHTLEAEKAAEILKAAIGTPNGELTIADAAAKGGIALREAELGLHHLSSQYRGTLSATEKGELLFKFPYGFSLPFSKRPGVLRFFDRVKKTVLGVGRFVVRAWVSIVLVGYVAIFVALAIALLLASSGRNNRGGGLGVVNVLFRVAAEALWWTFHPFSPVARRNIYNGFEAAPRAEKAPFYERVNHFVFGPDVEKPDAREMERRLLATIRAAQGRIGIGDVMRVTGLPREEADPLMARLMLDYEGDVEVSDDGGITWKFPALRRTASSTHERAPQPVWTHRVEAPPLTGNDAGSNWLIAGLNGFTLGMSLLALKLNMTVDRVIELVQQAHSRIPLPPLPYDGIPIALGVIPFVFSTLLFALPVYRWATEGAAKKKAADENARRAVLKTVLDEVQKAPDVGVSEGKLKAAWKNATGVEPSDKELIAHVVSLGGDLDVERGHRYRFRDLEAEVAALHKERAEASVEEERVGEVVFRAE